MECGQEESECGERYYVDNLLAINFKAQGTGWRRWAMKMTLPSYMCFGGGLPGGQTRMDSI